jgi:hypothetical protein
MQAAELVAMCAARGIDLTHVGGNASNIEGAASPRRLTHAERKHRQEEHLSIHVEPTARGNGSRVYRRPAYSLAELGVAANGVPTLPWLAAFYSWGGDRDPNTYSELFWALAHHGDSVAKRERWSPGVKRLSRPLRPFYLHELVGLLLEEEGDLRRYFIAAQTVHAIYMDVDEATWAKHLAGPYASLKQRYESWLGTAGGMIQRRISGDRT